VLSVKEIIEYGIVTKVPTTPPYIGASSTCAAASCR
jgi:hypothetical protein